MEFVLIALLVLALPICAIAGMSLGLQNRTTIRLLEERIAALEGGKVAVQAAGPAPEPTLAGPPVEQAAEPVTEAESEKTVEPELPIAAAEMAEQPEAAATVAPVAEEVRKASLEERLGTRWTVWVGGLSLALGGVFLVRYSIEAGLLGPGMRIALGALFSAALLGAGEWFRRRQIASGIAGVPSAHIPSVLTAAGTVAAFATVFAAHSLYSFIGPAAAFIMLAVIAIGCMFSAALHGPALAGLGLLGAALAPLLVSSSEPNPWALFLHLVVVVAAALGLARLREWAWLAVSAGVMALAWGLVYVIGASTADAAPLAFLVFAVSSLFVVYHAMGDDDGNTDKVTVGILSAFAVLALATVISQDHGSGTVGVFTALIVLHIAAAWRFPSLTPVLGSTLGFVLLTALSWEFPLARLVDPTNVFPGPGEALPIPNRISTYFTFAALHGALLLAAGTAMAFVSRHARSALVWSGVAAAAPVALLAIVYWRVAELAPDLGYAAVAGVLAAGFAFLAERSLRREAEESAAAGPTGLFAAAAACALALGLSMTLREGYLTISLSLLAAALAWVYSARPIPALRVLSVIAGVIVLGLTAINPLVIDNLGTTPVFNPLLWGYGVPALSFGAAAWLFQRSGTPRAGQVFEGLAMLYTVLLFVFEIRHWAQNGDMTAGAMSIYEIGLNITVLFLIAAIVRRLDLRNHSKVLATAVPVLSAIAIAISVVGALTTGNPYFSGETIGHGPFLAALFLGYAVPAAAATFFALETRNTQPKWQAPAAASIALALIVAYATLEVRSAFHGPNLKYFEATDVEIYAYSVVWLVLGIALLVGGMLLKSRVVRMGSAAVILLAVLKVFLYDLNDLEGILRALSFMGLGLVLVGIGVVYQKLLFGPKPTDEAAA
ncbi:DUF2339 domain-containing protein [Flaviflagellibacter deserti]|uniref:DUF2339 domain-containing protein n=1 Tax=Flaviflagellibacter deserti TaxID=2267266 RepID=A0ABV9YWH9_9HYPH